MKKIKDIITMIIFYGAIAVISAMFFYQFLRF